MRERERTGAYWMYGTHAVRAAVANPERRILQLLYAIGHDPETGPDRAAARILPPRQIAARLPPGTAHGGAAAEVIPLQGGRAALHRLLERESTRLLVVLDQVTDPGNVGAVLRSAGAFGAAAVLAPSRGAPAESGALAKAASGALDRVPYLRTGNLAATLVELDRRGWTVLGLDESATTGIDQAAAAGGGEPVALVLGAEGSGLRRLTRERCRQLVRIPTTADMPALNVAAAAAVSLFALTRSEEAG